jgi:hypothetical protein
MIMPTQMPSDQPAKWLGLPVIATIVRILFHELTLQNEYLFIRKIASCMFGSIAGGYGYFSRICHIPLDYLHRVSHNPGTSYSDNKILKELALFRLLNANCL